MSYVIVKMIKTAENSLHLPVILLDSTSEVMEFETETEAEDMRRRFQVNSDSGYSYQIKKIGSNAD
jgi:hypothetical protein